MAGPARGTANIFAGIELKEIATEPGSWGVWLGSWGEMLTYEDNRATLNKEKTDKWGLPTLDIDCEFKENEFAMREGLLLNSYFLLKHMSLSDEKAFGLEKSDVEVEQIPLVYQPITNIKLDRKIRH